MSDNDLALEMLLDYFDAVEAGIASAKQRLREKKGIKEESKPAA